MARKAAAPWRIYPRDGYAWIDTSPAGLGRVRRSLDVALDDPPSRAQRRTAEAAAEKYYRKLVSGRVITASERILTALQFEESYGMWLDEIETPNNKGSIATRRTYGRNLMRWAESISDDRTPFERVAADWGPQAFAQWSLCRSIRKTVKKEVSNLFLYFRFALKRGHISQIPPRPELPLSEPGVRTGKQRSKPVHITPVEALQIVRALPEWSPGRLLKGKRHGKFRVRAPNEFGWEMAMRGITVGRLRVPENWRKGASELELTDADDKARYGRTLKLTARARAILEECAPDSGPIFGHHEYSEFLKAAALKVLPQAKAKQFAYYDFRHGRAKHLLRATGNNLEGVAFILGHKQLTTTNAYLGGDGKVSGDDVIDAIDEDLVTILAPDTDEEGDSSVGAGGFEPPTPRPPEQSDPASSGENGNQGATESADSDDEPPPRRSHSARFRHEVLTDLERSLHVERDVWDAFDVFSYVHREEDVS